MEHRTFFPGKHKLLLQELEVPLWVRGWFFCRPLCGGDPRFQEQHWRSAEHGGHEIPPRALYTNSQRVPWGIKRDLDACSVHPGYGYGVLSAVLNQEHANHPAPSTSCVFCRISAPQQVLCGEMRCGGAVAWPAWKLAVSSKFSLCQGCPVLIAGAVQHRLVGTKAVADPPSLACRGAGSG